MSATDNVALRKCILEEVVISDLCRFKAGEWPRYSKTSFRGFSGSSCQVMVSVRNRFPISALKVEIKSDCGLEFNAFPLGRVFFPEEDTFLQDILVDAESFNVPANTTSSFLLTADIPTNFQPGSYHIKLKLSSASHSSWNGEFYLSVNALTTKSAVTDDLRMVFWPHWQTFCLRLGLKLWSEEFWAAAEKYLKEMAAGGMNVIMTSINSDPFRYPLPEEFYHYNLYPGMIEWRRDSVMKIKGKRFLPF